MPTSENLTHRDGLLAAGWALLPANWLTLAQIIQMCASAKLQLIIYHRHWWSLFNSRKQKYEILECQGSTALNWKTAYQIMTEVLSIWYLQAEVVTQRVWDTAQWPWSEAPVLAQMPSASLYSVVPSESELLLCQYLFFQIINFYNERTLAKTLHCFFFSSLPCKDRN